MKRAEFAERQYEIAVHIELARGGAGPFVPTQAAEKYIGVDAASDPAKWHAIWQILSVQIPRRVELSPTLWPELPPRFHNQIPGRMCSLFMQFKRPVFQDRKSAKYFAHIGGTYFQVGITPHQQQTLLRLERRLRTKAVIRYAAPAFWSRSDFELHDRHRQVLSNSAYISPARVKKHRQWMYSGPIGRVVVNPIAEEFEDEGWEAVVDRMRDLAERETLRQHVRKLAEVLGSDVMPDRAAGWLSRLAQYGVFSDEDNRFLSDLSTVARAAEMADSAWLVMLLPDDEWRRQFELEHRTFPPWWRHWSWWLADFGDN